MSGPDPSTRFFGEEHACEDEGGAEKEPDGDLFVEEPPGEENGGDGVEIHPVGGDDGTEFADDPIPGDITDHRGNDTQKQQIQENGKIEELENGRCKDPGFLRPKDKIRDDGEETIEEHLACDEQGGITFSGRLH